MYVNDASQNVKRQSEEGVFEKNDKSTSNKHNYTNLQYYGLFGKVCRQLY